MNVLGTQAAVGDCYQLRTQNTGELNTTVITSAGPVSCFQWVGTIDDSGALVTGVETPLPDAGSGVSYAFEFATSDWTLLTSGPPRAVYNGPTRLFSVTVNGHFESLAPDGEAHLPFMNLYQNAVLVHHTHASVIIDVPPVLESSLSTTTLCLIQAGDSLTVKFGSDNISDVAAELSVGFFVVLTPVT